MAEIVDHRPKIYSRDLQEQPFSLMGLISGIKGHADYNVSHGSFYLNGTLLTTGQHIDADSRITNFFAYRYVTDMEHNPTLIPGFLADQNWSAAVFLDTSRILLLPTRNYHGQYYHLLANWSSYKAKLGPSGWWWYTGGLAEALQEFGENGWVFDLGKHPSSREEVFQRLQQSETNPRLRPLGALLIEENIDLNRALKIISQNPKV